MNQKIEAVIRDLEKVADYLPCAVIVHDLRDMSIVYMTPLGLETIGSTLEEVKTLSVEEYHQRYFNPEDAADYVPRIKEIVFNNETERIVSFFQQVRKTTGSEWKWHLSNSKILLHDKQGGPLLMITLANPIDPFHHLTHKVTRLLEENNFIRSNFGVFSRLTPREKEVLALTVKGNSAPDIAVLLRISVLTVETHKRNIKSKLGVSSTYELTRFAQAFDLLKP